MLRAIRATVVASLVVLSPAMAGGRGGHVTSWEGNLLGGGWVCLQAQVAGCSQGFNATCNGVADDTSAYQSFLAAFSGLSAKVYIAPGANCKVSWNAASGPSINNTGPGTTPIKRLTIWGTGATWNADFTSNTFTNNVLALINSANPGDTTVTAKNIGDLTNFTVGRWVVVGGGELQHGGFPPNFQFYEIRQITAKTGAVITLSSPLANQYLSTWPSNVNNDGSLNNDGPAAIWLLDVNWDSCVTIYGMTFVASDQISFGNRCVELYDDVFPFGQNMSPTVNQTFWSFFTYISSSEIDKDIEFAGFYRNTIRFMTFQSPAPASLLMDSSTVWFGLNGPGANATFRNFTITSPSPPDMIVGPQGFGHGGNWTIDGATIPSAVAVVRPVDKTTVGTFAFGTFTIVNTSSTNVQNALGLFVPGQKYYFSDLSGGACAPLEAFKVTGLRQDSTNTYIDTDIGNSLPTPTCGGLAYTGYSPYAAATITQKFSGPADLTQFAAPP